MSLDCDDGQVLCRMEVLEDGNIETDKLFYNLTQKKLFDDHLWVSLLKRPYFSRFSRVQRLWCLVALLFLAMISSAMWYSERIMQTIKVGLIKLNYKHFYVGLMSSVIVIP